MKSTGLWIKWAVLWVKCPSFRLERLEKGFDRAGFLLEWMDLRVKCPGFRLECLGKAFDRAGFPLKWRGLVEKGLDFGQCP